MPLFISGPSCHNTNQYTANEIVSVSKGKKWLDEILPHWGKEFSVEFDLVIKTLDHFTGSWQNIIHLTVGVDDGLGRRIPAVYLHKSGFLGFYSQINNHETFLPKGGEFYIELNKNYSIRIAQQNVSGKFIYSVTINGKILFSVENEKPTNFEEVFVYTSNPWDETFGPSGTLSNLKIQNYGNSP